MKDFLAKWQKSLKQESLLTRLVFSYITLAAKWITGRQEEILGDHLESGCSRANDEGTWIRMIAE